MALTWSSNRVPQELTPNKYTVRHSARCMRRDESFRTGKWKRGAIEHSIRSEKHSNFQSGELDLVKTRSNQRSWADTERPPRVPRTRFIGHRSKAAFRHQLVLSRGYRVMYTTNTDKTANNTGTITPIIMMCSATASQGGALDCFAFDVRAKQSYY